jgi:ribosomal-protein-alanine N-acetyltransferase
MSTSPLTLAPYTLNDISRVLHILQHPDRLFTQIDWQTLPRWLLHGDRCGVMGLHGDQLVGLLVAGAPRDGTAWVRVAALSGNGLLVDGGGYASRLRQMWDGLTARLLEAGGERVVMLPTADWLRQGLEPLGFHEADRILEMRYARRERPNYHPLRAELRLRPGDSADLDTLLAIDTASFAPLWRMDRADLEAALEAGARITLAEDAGQIVGFQITYGLERRVHFARLAVAPDYQGQGIGGTLLAADLAVYQGAPVVTLNVLDSNAEARRLYTCRGFVVTGDDVPLWELDLS